MLSAVALDPRTGAQFLEGLGFLLTPDGSGDQAPSYLLVALRTEPTLRHFDPERVEYWTATHGRGLIDQFSRTTHVPLDHPFSWGTIRVVDRLEVHNDYLTFGGQLSAARLDGFTVAVFASPAPMLKTTGHSQTPDPGAHPLTAFFAHLRAVAGACHAVEGRLSEVSPVAIYAAYVQEAFEKYRHSPTLRSMHPNTWISLARQEGRLRQTQPSAWADARGLLETLQAPASLDAPDFPLAALVNRKELSDART